MNKQKYLYNPTRFFWLFTGFIVILSVILVLINTNTSLEIDEPFSANMTQLSWGAMYKIFEQDVAAPLYYTLLKIWASVFGDSERALRSLSTFFFALTILTIGITAQKMEGVTAGVLAVLLSALCKVGTSFAGTARPYALLSLLTAINTLFLFQIIGLIKENLTSESRLVLISGFVIINVLGILTHPIYIFFMIGCNLAVLLIARQYLWTISLCNILTIGLYLIIWGPILFKTINLPAIDWMEAPNIKDLIHGYLNIWGIRRTILLVGFTMLSAIWNFYKTRDFLLSQTALIGLTILLSMSLLPFIVSQFRPVFNDMRIPALFFPIACVLLSVLLARFRPGWLAVGLLTAMLGLALESSLINSRNLAVENSPKGSMEYVIQNAKCGDIFIAGGLSLNETTYYMRRLNTPTCIKYKVFPASMNDHPGWMDPPSLLEHHATLAQEADTLVKDLDQKLGANGRVWFFYEADDYRQNVLDILKGQLDQDMVLTQTLEGYGSFFDKIYIYTPKH